MGERQPTTGLRVGDDVHVDVAGVTHGALGHARAEQTSQRSAPAVAEDQLGGVLGAGEGEQGLRNVVAEDLVVGAAERLDQEALRGQRPLTGPGEAVGPGDVHGQQVAAAGPGRDPRRAADERLALASPCQGDHDALPGLPGPGDVVLLAVGLQRVVHAVGGPEQGQLAQGVEVPGSEVVGERGVDLLGGVHVAVGHPALQRLGGHVHQLDLVRGADHGVGHRLALGHAGDLLDDVVDGLQVLDVDRGDHVDAGSEQLLDVLPPLGVARPRHVGVGQLVDKSEGGASCEHRVEVHLGEGGAAVGHRAARHHLEPLDLLGGVRPAVGLHEPDHHVGAALEAAVTLAEHRVGLAHARCRTEVDPEPAAGTHVPSLPGSMPGRRGHRGPG